MKNPRIDQLRSIPTFADCSSSELEVISRHADDVKMPAGTTLIVQDRPNTTLWALLEGEVEVTVAGKPRTRLGRGQIFGEISIDSRSLATATVKTVTPIHALVFSTAQYRAVSGSRQAREQVRRIIESRLAADRAASAI